MPSSNGEEKKVSHGWFTQMTKITLKRMKIAHKLFIWCREFCANDTWSKNVCTKRHFLYRLKWVLATHFSKQDTDTQLYFRYNIWFLSELGIIAIRSIAIRTIVIWTVVIEKFLTTLAVITYVEPLLKDKIFSNICPNCKVKRTNVGTIVRTFLVRTNITWTIIKNL